MNTFRRIAHVDMDAFYASVALLRYPDLRGHQVVIGGRSVHGPRFHADGSPNYVRLKDYAGRGVVTTASYEARAKGIFSAMGLMKAALLAPDAYLLPADFDSYRRYSRLFKQAVAKVSDQIENRGIDEIYVDLSHLTESSEELAKRIQKEVFEATGLTCSVGISPNKLLAKIASDLNKPNGICLLSHEHLLDRVWPLATSKINGIGPKSQKKLAQLSIYTVKDIVEADPALLQKHFGLSYAKWLKEAAQGIDERPVVLSSEPKTMSRERTFERDYHVTKDKAALSAQLYAMCNQLEQDLVQKGYRAFTLGIKLRFDDFSLLTRDFTLERPIYLTAELMEAARQNLRRTNIKTRRLRLLGIRAAKLIPEQDCKKIDLAPVQLDFGDLF